MIDALDSVRDHYRATCLTERLKTVPALARDRLERGQLIVPNVPSIGAATRLRY